MTTKHELDIMAGKINNVLDHRKLNREVVIGYAYGQPMAYLYRKNDSALLQELSPRMSKPQLEQWLTAFYNGLTLFPCITRCYECDKEMTDYRHIVHVEDSLVVCSECFDKTMLLLDDDNQVFSP